MKRNDMESFVFACFDGTDFFVARQSATPAQRKKALQPTLTNRVKSISLYFDPRSD
jgi:hypothetical protein